MACTFHLQIVEYLKIHYWKDVQSNHVQHTKLKFLCILNSKLEMMNEPLPLLFLIYVQQ
jgi:hypothetical protein